MTATNYAMTAQSITNLTNCGCAGAAWQAISGSPSGAADDGILTSCCTNRIPRILTVTFSDASGDCGCLEDFSFQIEWDDGANYWQAGGDLEIPEDCSPMGSNFSLHPFTLTCEPTDSGDFEVAMAQCAIVIGQVYTTKSCDPFEMVFEGVDVGECCTEFPGDTVTMTISE